MPLRYAILWCLARGIRHGYDIRRALGDMTDGLWDINPGHVYQAFRALERDGLVTLTEIVPQHNLPDRKEYALTPAGQAALAQWIGKPVPAERPTKDEALLKLDGKTPSVEQLWQRQVQEHWAPYAAMPCTMLPTKPRSCSRVGAKPGASSQHQTTTSAARSIAATL